MLGWEPIPWNLGFFRSRRRKRGFSERAAWNLVWRKAGGSDWPPNEVLDADLDWARRTGTGYIADKGAETLYLIDRDWFGWPDPPRWGLASRLNANAEWHIWGSFDEVPPAWSFIDGIEHAKTSLG